MRKTDVLSAEQLLLENATLTAAIDALRQELDSTRAELEHLRQSEADAQSEVRV